MARQEIPMRPTSHRTRNWAYSSRPCGQNKFQIVLAATISEYRSSSGEYVEMTDSDSDVLVRNSHEKNLVIEGQELAASVVYALNRAYYKGTQRTHEQEYGG